MTIQIDTREKAEKIKHITDYFDAAGIKHFRSKLAVGDYIDMDFLRYAIDRKKNLLEVCQNICQGHERFKNELELANELGIRMALLIEHGNAIRTLNDVRYWRNPRKKISPYALDGADVYKRLLTINKKYGVDIYFCNKHQTGEKIAELLKYRGETYGIKIGG